MFLRFADRPSDSPYIERVWRGRSDGGGPFLSVAAGHLELVVTRLADFTMVQEQLQPMVIDRQISLDDDTDSEV